MKELCQDSYRCLDGSLAEWYDYVSIWLSSSLFRKSIDIECNNMNSIDEFFVEVICTIENICIKLPLLLLEEHCTTFIYIASIECESLLTPHCCTCSSHPPLILTQPITNVFISMLASPCAPQIASQRRRVLTSLAHRNFCQGNIPRK